MLVVCGGALACTSTAGPFVTNIRAAGPGRLSVTQCEVTFSKWTSSISTDEDSCSVSIVEIPTQAPVVQQLQPQTPQQR